MDGDVITAPATTDCGCSHRIRCNREIIIEGMSLEKHEGVPTFLGSLDGSEETRIIGARESSQSECKGVDHLMYIDMISRQGRSILVVALLVWSGRLHAGDNFLATDTANRMSL